MEFPICCLFLFFFFCVTADSFDKDEKYLSHSDKRFNRDNGGPDSANDVLAGIIPNNC